jgi:osmotically-inducible protein OsmY
MKNDVLIQHDVVAELDREQNVIAGSIGVEVHHGVVKLAGRVNDPTAKKSAELAARRVPDVKTVLMDVDVAGGGAPAQPPREIPRSTAARVSR